MLAASSVAAFAVTGTDAATGEEWSKFLRAHAASDIVENVQEATLASPCFNSGSTSVYFVQGNSCGQFAFCKNALSYLPNAKGHNYKIGTCASQDAIFREVTDLRILEPWEIVEVSTYTKASSDLLDTRGSLADSMLLAAPLVYFVQVILAGSCLLQNTLSHSKGP